MDTSAPADPKPASWQEWVKSAPISALIVVINLAVFAVAERAGSTNDTATLLRFGAVWRGEVWSGEWWRLFTSMWLHIGVVHLVWNQWFGFRMCATTERDLGKLPFIGLYVASGMAGAAASVIGHDVVGAGSSGALFGLIGARYLRARLALGSWGALWSDPIMRRDLTWTGMWFVLGLYANFDNYAHFGGLVFGTVATWALIRLPAKVPLAVAAALFALLVGASLRPLPVLHARDRELTAAWQAATAKDWERVLAATDRLAKELPIDPWVLDTRLTALIELRRWADALPLAEQRAATGDSRGFQLRATTYEGLKRTEAALADLDRALARAPGDAWTLQAHLRLNIALWKHDAAKADAALLLAKADSASLHFSLATVALHDRDKAAARSEIAKAVALAPNDADVALGSAEVLALVGDDAAALSQLDAAKLPDAPTAWQRQVVAYVAMHVGQVERARHQCDGDLRDASLAQLCGWIMMFVGDAAHALEFFERAVAVERLQGAVTGLALLAHRNGDAARAEQLSMEGLALDPNDALALMVRAEVLLAAGDEAAARDSWKLALEHSPPSWLEGRLASDALRALVPEQAPQVP